MKPVVGILPSIGIERDRIFLLKDYMTSIRDAGGLPVVLFPETDAGNIRTLLKLCDGLVFSGGEDVNPVLYGENNDMGLSNCCDERDLSEMMFLKDAMALKLPILGICRGIQSINVALGGTLYQDISIQRPSLVQHMQSRSDPKPTHPVKVREESGLYRLLGQEAIEVNSYHHQAIKDLAEGLICSAESEDGLCEAFEKEDYPFLWAVQWHPERIYRTDEPSRLLLQRFMKSVTEYAKNRLE